MVYHSLMDVPCNLKEGIDWLIALKGNDAEKNIAAMGAAVYDFLVDKPVGKMNVPALEKVKLITKKFLATPKLMNLSFVQSMFEKFKRPMAKRPCLLAKMFRNFEHSDYENVLQTKKLGSEIVLKSVGKVADSCDRFLNHIKTTDSYTSAYSSEATWDASCAKDPEACAVVLVGIAPMLWAGLTSLWDATNPQAFGCGTALVDNRSRAMLNAVGYEESEYRNTLGRVNLRNALLSMDYDTLRILYYLAGFWAFY
ncbi:hypothetical protein BBBOND_0108190 [Babesia bigemina]|uniref:Uncharacterized protein n=1 Tax=Babesia bigemina TaxID=5866 RepID=A0A061D122_BABBI|nr:hypothetical protein BBBOND_0108190 [Babesia bigemina]CDR94521.1 hypothetical protein BBBOND_0108190 [Babesia bigemina]|eukprot:XP_012766707.1 hypothetical protein BBBOND_0108190 [Babesia bigemina]